jgi:hypothetical protein
LGGAVQIVLALAVLLKLPPEPVQLYPKLCPNESEAATLIWACPPEFTELGVAVGAAVIVMVSTGPTAFPLPSSEIVSLPALLVISAFPVKSPVLCGVKRTVTCWPWPAVRLNAPPATRLKGGVGPTLTDPLNVPPPLLSIVKVWSALVPTSTGPKPTTCVLIFNTGLRIPLPDKGTGLVPPIVVPGLATVAEPGKLPSPAGQNCSPTLTPAPFDTVNEPFDVMLKGAFTVTVPLAAAVPWTCWTTMAPAAQLPTAVSGKFTDAGPTVICAGPTEFTWTLRLRVWAAADP